MGKIFSGIHLLDNLNMFTSSILFQVVAIMNYIISSQPGLMFPSTTGRKMYRNCTVIFHWHSSHQWSVDNQFTLKFDVSANIHRCKFY